MPNFGKNPKKVEAKEREQQKKDQKKIQDDKFQEDMVWKETDKNVIKKQTKEQERLQKEKLQKEKQLEKKQLYEEELNQLSSAKNKPSFKDIKVFKDNAEKASQKIDQDLKEKYTDLNSDKITKQVDHNADDSDDLEETLDKEFTNFYKMQGVQSNGLVVADNIDKALSLLTIDGKVDKHPEKRIKAIWNKHVEENLPKYRKDYPGLKRAQVVNIMWKEFEKSETNPMNNPNNFSWQK
jgi:hypothetical protein